jgi:hypothetical protein
MIAVRTLGFLLFATLTLEFVPFVSFLGALRSLTTDTFIILVVSPRWTPGVANKAFAIEQNAVVTLGLFMGDAVTSWGHG